MESRPGDPELGTVGIDLPEEDAVVPGDGIEEVDTGREVGTRDGYGGGVWGGDLLGSCSVGVGSGGASPPPGMVGPDPPRACGRSSEPDRGPRARRKKRLSGGAEEDEEEEGVRWGGVADDEEGRRGDDGSGSWGVEGGLGRADVRVEGGANEADLHQTRERQSIIRRWYAILGDWKERRARGGEVGQGR